MAARARTRTQGDRATERVRVKGQVDAPEAHQLTGRMHALRPAIDLPPRLRNELIAFCLFTLAVIAALPTVGLAGNSILQWAGTAFAYLLGRAAIAVPFGLSVIAVEVWREDVTGQRVRRLLGGVVTLVAIVGLLGLAARDEPVRATGGYLGWLVVFLLTSVIGEVGTGLALLAVGIAGIFLVSGSDSRSLVDSWRRIRYRPIPEADLIDERDLDSRDEAELQPLAISSTAEMPVARAVVVEPPGKVAEPRSPVIKIPKSSSTKRETKPAARPEPDPAKPPEGAGDGWKLPPLDMLAVYETTAPDSADLEAKARRIEETLNAFKVDARVREIYPGPAVTMFALEPAMGVKVSKITGLHNDLALALAAQSIRIEAPVPGKARVGIEIPNGSIATVGLRETVESVEFAKSNTKLPLPLGRDVNGRYVIGDLAKMPHLLIAGATGSGKSVCINGIIATFLLTKTPDDLRMIMIDPKMVELAGYEGVPHLKAPVVTDMDKVVSALRAVLREMERRYQIFTRLGVRNIDGYELRRTTEPTLEKLPYLVVIIDELADLMMTTPDEVETLLVRLAQMARATGIHLLIATQRPSVDVLTGLIKTNIPARVAFAVTSQIDSRVILDMPGAERLLGRGDMLFMPADAAKPYRIQGSYIDDQDLQKIVNHWRLLTPHVEYEPEWAQLPSSDDDGEGGDDPLMEHALQIVRQQGTASASMLQRRLRIGYNRAARLIERMEDEGIIGPADGSKVRPVLDLDDWDDE